MVKTKHCDMCGRNMSYLCSPKTGICQYTCTNPRCLSYRKYLDKENNAEE